MLPESTENVVHLGLLAPRTSVMKPVLQLQGNLHWIGVVRAAEGVAVVEQVAVIGEVERGESRRPVFAKGLAQAQVGAGMRRQVARAVAIQEARAIREIDGTPSAPRQGGPHAGTQRIALIVIEKVVRAALRRRKIRQAAAHPAAAFSVKTSVRQVPLQSVKQFGRARRRLPTVDASAHQRQRKEDVGVAQDVVIEVVARGGAELVEVHGPTLGRNRETELVLLVLLSVQREEAQSLGSGE